MIRVNHWPDAWLNRYQTPYSVKAIYSLSNSFSSHYIRRIGVNTLTDWWTAVHDVFLFQYFPAAEVCRFRFQRRFIGWQMEKMLPWPAPSTQPDQSPTHLSSNGRSTPTILLIVWWGQINAIMFIVVKHLMEVLHTEMCPKHFYLSQRFQVTKRYSRLILNIYDVPRLYLKWDNILLSVRRFPVQ